MDTLKGLADVVQQLLYETLGLLLPGLVAVIAVTAAVDPAWTAQLLRYGAEHLVLSIAGIYVAGYVLQGLSRPIVQLSEAGLSVTPKVVLRVIGGRARGYLDRLERYLTGRHAHAIEDASTPAIDVEALVASVWKRRLGLGSGDRLRPEHIRDLSFSAMLSSRGHLDRFRASVSLCRGVAATISLVLGILAVQIAFGSRVPSWYDVGVIEMLVVAFYALMERADMYDRLWRNIVPTQFLAAATTATAPSSPAQLAGTETAPPPPISTTTSSRSTHA